MKSITFSFTLVLLAFTGSLYSQSSAPFFNEINYKASNPSKRGAEVAGEAGTDMTGWSIATYNADGTQAGERPINGGTIPDQQNGHGSVWYDIEQSSQPSQPGGGLALVDPQGTVVRFVSYGSLLLSAIVVTAVEGPAQGMTSEYVGTQLLSGSSLQLVGTALEYLGFLWSLPLGSTPGNINTGQLFGLLGLMSTEQQDMQMAATQTQNSTAGSDATVEISLYPNPVTDQIQVSLNQVLGQTAELRIFDAEGRMVKATNFEAGALRKELDISELPGGQYIVQLVTADGPTSKIFMKR